MAGYLYLVLCTALHLSAMMDECRRETQSRMMTLQTLGFSIFRGSVRTIFYHLSAPVHRATPSRLKSFTLPLMPLECAFSTREHPLSLSCRSTLNQLVRSFSSNPPSPSPPEHAPFSPNRPLFLPSYPFHSPCLWMAWFPYSCGPCSTCGFTP